MLDQQFFTRISVKDDPVGSFRWEAYKAVNTRSSLVLFSRKTGTALAALTLKATDDVGCLSMITGRPSPPNGTEPYFQGMLNMPNEAFSFVITNLSDTNMISFNILHTPHRVSEVNPGPSYGINEVNELRKNQSVGIEADQRTGRQMVLAGKTKTVVNPVTKTTKEVAVSVDETETDSEQKGLYFYLSVVPDRAASSLVEKFAEGTVWKVTPGFVRQVPKAVNDRSWLPPDLDGSFGRPSGSVQRNDIRNLFDDGRKRFCSFNNARLAAAPVNVNDGCEGFCPLQKTTQRLAASVHVGATQAGELSYGRHVKVRSDFTGHDYDYERCSEPAVLCMSIWEEMSFLPLPNLSDELETEMDDMIKNHGKQLIESLNAVYKSDTCAIDLESKADTIICSCGHQCINHANVNKQLRRCPLCRSPIAAFVRADGIIVQ
jgi:hypothetical protein